MTFSRNIGFGVMVAVLLTALTLTGCNFDFLSGGGDGGTDEVCITTYETEDLDGDGLIDRKTAIDCTGTLLWGEAYRYDASDNRIGTRRYSPSGGAIPWDSETLSDIVSTTLYQWTGSNRTLLAYYRPGAFNHELQYYTRSSYSGDRLILEANFEPAGGSDELQWYEVRQYTGDLETYRARFDGEDNGQWLYHYEYDGSDRIELTTAYAASGGPAASVASSPVYAVQSAGVSSTPWAFGVGLPEPLGAFPTAPDLSADPATFGLDLLWTQQYWYTPSGYVSMRYDRDLKPLLMHLEDSSLDDPVEVEIAYNASDLPASKVTTYGSTEVLRLEFAYTGGLVSRIETSGASLLVPLEYEIAYNADSVPSRISVYRDDTLLQYFDYTYGAGGSPTSVDDLFDPISFGGRVDTITQYNGDDQEIGHYEFTYDIGATDDIRIDAWEHDGGTDTPSGYFLLERDGSGRTASFSSYSASDERIWYYQYSYDDLGNRIAEARYDGNDIPSVPTGFDEALLFE